MNRLPGRILAVEASDGLSLVEVEVAGGGPVLTALLLETPETDPRLVPGREVAVRFKETEVMIAPGDPGPLSVRNRLPARVIAVAMGRLLARVRLACGERPLDAVITARAAAELALRPGDAVLALVKSTEVGLEGPDPGPGPGSAGRPAEPEGRAP